MDLKVFIIKIFSKFILFFIFIFFSQASSVDQFENNKVLITLSSFNSLFNKGDYKEMVSFFDLPFTIILPNKTLLAQNNKKLISIYKNARNEQPKHYKYSEWQKMSVKLLNNEIAIVNTMYSEYNNKNEVFFTGSALYTLRKVKNNWKIISLTQYKPYNFFKVD